MKWPWQRMKLLKRSESPRIDQLEERVQRVETELKALSAYVKRDMPDLRKLKSV